MRRLAGGLWFGSCSLAAMALAWGSQAAPDDAIVPDWVLVRLERSVDLSVAAEAPLRTNLRELDAAIATAGITKIEAVFVETATAPLPRFLASDLSRTYRFHVPRGTDVRALAARLSACAGVTWAEPDYVVRTATIPNDPQYSSQWNLDQLSNHDINAPTAWDIATGTSKVVIAVIDTGVDLAHEDFASKLTAGHNFLDGTDVAQDDNGHGTNVASIAGARTNNAKGVAGVCWSCPIMPLKSLGSGGTGSWSNVAAGLRWAADHGAAIANMSIEGTSGNQTMLDAIQYARDAGLVMTAAMGNGGSAVPNYPAFYPETIAVGGTDTLDRRDAFVCGAGASSYGSHIDVVAPGVNILGAKRGGGYSSMCGTSQATPHVSGLAGLILGVNPAAGREEIRHLIAAGARDQIGLVSEDTLGFDVYHGWGRIDAHRSAQAAQASVTMRIDKSPIPRIYFATFVAVATSYDFIRGNLAAISESAAGVDLGPTVCLANDSASASTSVAAVGDHPAPGEVYFYLSRFNAAPGAGSYGGSTRRRDRLPSSGDCAR